MITIAVSTKHNMHNASLAVLSTRTADTSLFLQQLKSETEQQHCQLEQQELLNALMSPGVTKKHYCAYLSIMHHLMLVYENEVLPVVQQVVAPVTALRASKQIGIDLDNIGCVLSGQTLVPYRLPKQHLTIPHALGFMYVIEGSKLGGKVIFKHINKTLGYSETSGAGYIANIGADTGAQWKHFLALFSNYTVTQNVASDVIDGARMAFDSIYHHYQNNRAYYAD